MGRLSLTGNSRTRSRLAVLPAAGASFNPVTDIAWAHLYYAGGPAFVALGLSNGASMTGTNWPDEIAANAAPLTSGDGVYASSAASFNSKPCVSVSAAAVCKYHPSTVAAGAQVALPYSIVCVAQFDSGASAQYCYDGANLGGTGQRVLFRISPGPVWSLYMGTDRTGGSATSGIKASRVSATSGNDVLTVNGSTIISGVNSGGGTWVGISLLPFMDFSTTMRIAFWGIYAGDITADGNWSALQAWVSSTYGVSIS